MALDVNVHPAGSTDHQDMEPETYLDADNLDTKFHEEARNKTNTPGKQVVDPND